MTEYSKLLTKGKKQFWKKNPINGPIKIEIPNMVDFSMYCENDDTVVKELYWTNFTGWEHTSLILWKELLTNFEQGTILDIGSYTGIYSLLASKYAKQSDIYAFEIQTNCIARLEKNIDINAIDNITIVNAACTDENGETTFHFYEEEGIISSVAGLMPKKMNNLQKEVKAVRLDDYFGEEKAAKPIKLIKMDVEGAEQATLKGMKNILEKYTPSILLEINNAKEIKDVKALFPKNYTVYDIHEDKLQLKKLRWYKKPTTYRNYLFTPLSKEELSTIFSGAIT